MGDSTFLDGRMAKKRGGWVIKGGVRSAGIFFNDLTVFLKYVAIS